MKKEKVKISLKGAVTQPGEILVDSNQTIWQVVIKDNKWLSFINWEKLPLSKKVFEGMEIEVPFRKLRSGERITYSELVASAGVLLEVIPCIDLYQKHKNENQWQSRIKDKETNNCLKKFISGY